MGDVLGARNPTTIREHLEAWQCDYKGGAGRRPCRAVIFAQAFPYDGPVSGKCPYHDHNLGCPNSHRPGTGVRVLVIPDPGVGAQHAPKEHP